MASRPIDERIVKLSLDDEGFKKNLTNAVTSLGNLDKGLNTIDGKNIDNAGKSTETLGSKLSNLVSKIPLVGTIASSIMSIVPSSGRAAEAVSAIGDGVEKARSKFSILETAAGVALGNIATSAIGAGANLLKNLTISPVMDGLQEYTQKLGAIQVMKSNTTASMGEINSALGRMNDYSDKTIYKFSDMTNAVGQMTTAGVDLNASVTATTGAFNLAAASGLSSVQANSMVQFGLTQAMTKGFLGMQDLVSFGAAGGKKFQDAAHGVADELGIAYDKSVSFRDSLHDGWLNTQVMTEVFKRFGDDPGMTQKASEAHSFAEAMAAVGESVGSGWAGIWEALIGDFDTATAMWTAFQENVGNSLKAPLIAIENFVKAFVQLGGKAAIVEGLSTVFKALTGTLGKIAGAWKDAFPTATITFAKILTNVFRILTSAIKIMLAPLQLVGPAFQVLFGVMRFGIDIIKLITTPLRVLTGLFTKGFNLEKTVNAMTNWGVVINFVSNKIRDLFSWLQKYMGIATGILSDVTMYIVSAFVLAGKSIVSFIKATINLGESLTNLTDPFKIVKRGFEEGTQVLTPMVVLIGLVRAAFDLVGASFKYVGDTIHNISAGFGAFFNAISVTIEPLKKLKDNFKEQHPELKFFFDGITKINNAVRPFVNGIYGALKSITELSTKLRTSGGAFKDFSVTMEKAGKGLGKYISNTINSINSSAIVTAMRQIGKDIVDGLFIGVGNKIRGFAAFILPHLKEFIQSVKDVFGIHSPSKVMAEIGKNIVEGLINGIKAYLGGLKSLFAIFGKIFQSFIEGLKTFGSHIPSIMQQMVSGFGKLVSFIAPYAKDLAKIFVAIGSGLSEFINQINFSSVLKGGIIIALAGWIRDLDKTKGPSILNKILHPIKALKEALSEKFGDSGLLLDRVQKTLKTYQNELRSKMIVNIAIAIAVLAGAVALLSRIPADKLVVSTAALVAAAGSLAVVFKVMQGVTKDATGLDTAKVMITMIGVSAALLIVSAAMKNLSSIPWKQALVGATTMSVILAAITMAFKFGLQVDSGKEMAGLLSLLALSLTVSSLANTVIKLSQMKWDQALVGLGSMSVVIGLLILVVRSMKVEDGASIASFTGLGIALNLAMAPIIILGTLPWTVVSQGLIGLVAVLGTMTLVNVILQKFGGNKGALSLMAMGVALNLAIAPIIILGLLPWSKLQQGLIGMGAALTILAGINVILSTFGGGSGAASLLAMAVALNMIVTPITVLGALPWQVVAGGVAAMAAGLGVLVLAALGAQLVLPGMAALSLLLGSFSLASISFGIGITMVVTALAMLAAVIITQGEKVVKGLGKMLTAIGNLGPVLGSAIGTLIGGVISGFAKAIASNLNSIVDIGVDLIDAFIQGILKSADGLIDAAVTIVNKLASAILNDIPVLAIKLGNAVISLLKTVGLFIQNNDAHILSAIAKIVGAVIKMITTALGDILGLIPGIGPKLKASVQKAGEDAVEGLNDTFPEGLNAATQKGAEAAVEGLAGMKEGMKTEALNLAMAAKDGASQITGFLSILGVQGADQFVSGVKSGTIGAQEAGAVLNEMAKAGASKENLEAIAKELGGSYANGIFTSDNKDKTGQASSNLKNEAKEKVKLTDGEKSEVNDAGNEINTQYKLGVETPVVPLIPGSKPGSILGTLLNPGEKETVSNNANEVNKTYIDKILGITELPKSPLPEGATQSTTLTEDQKSRIVAAGQMPADSYGLGLQNGIPGVVGAAGLLKDSSDNKLGEIKDHSGSSLVTANSVATGIGNAQGSVNTNVDSIINKTNTLGISKDFSSMNFLTSNSVAAGIGAGIPGVSGGVSRIGTTVDLLGTQKSFYGTASSTSASVGSGIRAGQGSVDGAVQGIDASTNNLGRSKDFSFTGSNIVGTLVDGMNSTWLGRGISIVSSIGRGIYDFLRTNSPSKKGYLHDHYYNIVNSGARIITDYAQRMEKAAPQVSDAANSVGELLTGTVENMNSIVNDGFDFTPSIAPVIDYSELKSFSMSGLNAQINGRINTKVDYDTMNQNNQQIARTNDVINSLQNGFSKLDEQMETLNKISSSQISAIEESGNRDIYMDTNKVGETLTPTINKTQQRSEQITTLMKGKRLPI